MLRALEKIKAKDIFDWTDSEAFLFTVSKVLVEVYGYSERTALTMVQNYHAYKDLFAEDKGRISFINHYSAEYWADHIRKYYLKENKRISYSTVSRQRTVLSNGIILHKRTGAITIARGIASKKPFRRQTNCAKKNQIKNDSKNQILSIG